MPERIWTSGLFVENSKPGRKTHAAPAPFNVFGRDKIFFLVATAGRRTTSAHSFDPAIGPHEEPTIPMAPFSPAVLGLLDEPPGGAVPKVS